MLRKSDKGGLGQEVWGGWPLNVCRFMLTIAVGLGESLLADVRD
jgi:hypothetical protein